MILPTGNSDQPEIAAAIMPQTISGGVRPTREIGKILEARKSFGSANTAPILRKRLRARGYPEQIRTSVAELSRFKARRPWWGCPA